MIQFDPKNGDTFYVHISRERVECGKGKRYAPGVEERLYLMGEQESLESLFKGEMTLAEAIYHHKIHFSKRGEWYLLILP
jgi:hypothetical protein